MLHHPFLFQLQTKDLNLFADDTGLFVTVHSTVWRKQKSGLQHWGSSWYPKGLQRARCPHSQFERGDCSLEINNVREEDGGVYSCKVESGHKVTENVISLRIIKGNKIIN